MTPEIVMLLLDSFSDILDPNLSPKTTASYVSAARRLFENPAAEIRNANDRRVVYLMSNWIDTTETNMVTALRNVLEENIAMGAIEHPSEIDADSIMVDSNMAQNLGDAATHAKTLGVLDDAGLIDRVRAEATSPRRSPLRTEPFATL